MSPTRERKVAASLTEELFENQKTETDEDETNSANLIRMTAEDVEYLIQKLGATLTKQDTTTRNAISERQGPHCGYTTASGISSLQYLFRIPVCIIGRIVKEDCEQLFAQLKEDHMEML
ncbi:hypothetical protein PR048_003591 [Dryococelus australis]|uniref:Uncharacterized protein n=1 Tax=Dryococelus australis TaxID=614101 RepID=A0ABQ9INH8_9NEOP|nr:hypothetical protein PR048_003591 [Dryococelus australis]